MEQLSKLPHAPSIGLHDVPTESLGAHLRVPVIDELDEELARKLHCHTYLLFIYFLLGQSHRVYKMQDDSGTTSGSSDDDDDASSTSSRYPNRKGKKRMSILTNQYHDIPSKERRKEFEQEFELCAGAAPRPQKRKFFQSSALDWDRNVEKVIALNRDITAGMPGGKIWAGSDLAEQSEGDDDDDSGEFDRAKSTGLRSLD